MTIETPNQADWLEVSMESDTDGIHIDYSDDSSPTIERRILLRTLSDEHPRTFDSFITPAINGTGTYKGGSFVAFFKNVASEDDLVNKSVISSWIYENNILYYNTFPHETGHHFIGKMPEDIQTPSDDDNHRQGADKEYLMIPRTVQAEGEQIDMMKRLSGEVWQKILNRSGPQEFTPTVFPYIKRMNP